jgi:hypothetical protein
MKEAEPKEQISEQFIKTSNHVYATCFPLKIKNAEMYDNTEEIKRSAFKRLREQRIKDQSVISPCETAYERIKGMLYKLVLNQETKPYYDKKPWVIVDIGEYPPIANLFQEEIRKNPDYFARVIKKPITIVTFAQIDDKREATAFTVNGISIKNEFLKGRLLISRY